MQELFLLDFCLQLQLYFCDEIVPTIFMFAVADIDISRYARVVSTIFLFAVADILILFNARVVPIRFPFAVANILVLFDARVVSIRFLFVVADIDILQYARVTSTRFLFAVAYIDTLFNSRVVPSSRTLVGTTLAWSNICNCKSISRSDNSCIPRNIHITANRNLVETILASNKIYLQLQTKI